MQIVFETPDVPLTEVENTFIQMHGYKPSKQELDTFYRVHTYTAAQEILKKEFGQAQNLRILECEISE